MLRERHKDRVSVEMMAALLQAVYSQTATLLIHKVYKLDRRLGMNSFVSQTIIHAKAAQLNLHSVFAYIQWIWWNQNETHQTQDYRAVNKLKSESGTYPDTTTVQGLPGIAYIVAKNNNNKIYLLFCISVVIKNVTVERLFIYFFTFNNSFMKRSQHMYTNSIITYQLCYILMPF